jgi:hypothetical protein
MHPRYENVHRWSNPCCVGQENTAVFCKCVKYTTSLTEQLSNYWIRNLLKNLKLPQPDKISATPNFNETRKCNISFANSAICPYPELDDKSSPLTSPLLTLILILSCHLRRGIPSGPFPSGFNIKPRANFSTHARPARYSQFNLNPLTAIDTKELRLKM